MDFFCLQAKGAQSTPKPDMKHSSEQTSLSPMPDWYKSFARLIFFRFRKDSIPVSKFTCIKEG